MLLKLYSRDQCGLCDEALEMIGELGLSAAEIDVEASDDLMAEYGLRIPVIADAAGRELGWPFDAEQLRDFVSSNSKID